MKSHLDFVDIGRGRFAKPGPREKEGGKLRIAFGEHSVVLHSWESKDQLLRFLSQCEEGSVLLGSNAEQQIDFFQLRFI